MTGTLSVIGLGPGDPHFLTEQARQAIAGASHFFGYFPYIERLELRDDQTAVASDNREELDRATAALTLAAEGKNVGMVSGGDPGVFAMAAAVCEAIEGHPGFDEIEIQILPGITAMLATAAAAGAPLGNDFCAISLSDNLKPWAVIEARVRAAAEAGFAIAFYNPISKSRPWQLGKTLEILRTILPAETVVTVGRAIGRDDQTVRHAALSDIGPEMIDMATCLIIGNVWTRVVTRVGQPDLVYTPRWVPEHD